MSFLPKQTAYIIGNEACERFGFYGLKGLLTPFLMTMFLMQESNAISVTHGFVSLVYLTPLIGAWLADRILGRYKTILYVSLIYCLGFAILSASRLLPSLAWQEWAFYFGLVIISLGSGGIKPCVSSFMGDQITDQSPKTMTRAYNAFYWSINLGSLFAFLIIPSVKDEFGWSLAFLIPGISMTLATFILWMGRKQYHHIPPQRNKSDSGFWAILGCVMFKGGFAKANGLFGAGKVEEVRRVLKIVSIFIFVIPFWSLFDQTASSWLIQGKSMTPIEITLPWSFGSDGGPSIWRIGAEQFQAANPVFIMTLIPIISIFIYPYIGKLARPLVRMGAGIFLSSISFALVAWIQYKVDNSPEPITIAWQLLPYLVLTVSEILVSTTGLEFAYTQAPTNMKSVITSFWNLTIFLGNLLVAILTWFMDSVLSIKVVSPTGFLVYAAMTALVTILFAYSARLYSKKS